MALTTAGVRVRALVDSYVSGIDKAKQKASQFGGEQRKLGGLLKDNTQLMNLAGTAGLALGAALVTAAAGAVKLTVNLARTAEEVQKNAIRANTSAEAYGRLSFALQQTGGSARAFNVAIAQINRTAGDALRGNRQFAELYEQLGVTIVDTNGAVKSGDQLFRELVGALGKVDPALRASIGSLLLGSRSFREILPLIDAGAEGLAALEDQADSLGGVFSMEFTEQSAEFIDNLGEIRLLLQGFGIAIAERILPTLNQLLDLLVEAGTRVLPTVRDVFGEVNFRIQKFGTVVLAAGQLLRQLKDGDLAGARISLEVFNEAIDLTRGQFERNQRAIARQAQAIRGEFIPAYDEAGNAVLTLNQLLALNAQNLRDIDLRAFGDRTPQRGPGERPREEIEGVGPAGGPLARVFPEEVVSGFETAEGAAREFFDSVTDLGQNAFQALGTFSSNFTKGLIDGAAGARVQFGKFFQQLLRDLAAAIARALILRAILGIFGGLFGSSGAFLSRAIGGTLRGGGGGGGAPAAAPAAAGAVSASVGTVQAPSGPARATVEPAGAVAGAIPQTRVIVNEPGPLTSIEFTDSQVVPRLEDRRDNLGAETL